nr:ribonuclease P protein component 1 [Candidatus Sigynarchaeota archaeon]
MPVSPSNVLFHELIGLHVRVHKSPCDSLPGLEGDIVDETMHTLVIERLGGRGTATVLKEHQEFAIILPDGREVLVPGNLLVGRPWDRLKNIGKKHHQAQPTKLNK